MPHYNSIHFCSYLFLSKQDFYLFISLPTSSLYLLPKSSWWNPFLKEKNQNKYEKCRILSFLVWFAFLLLTDNLQNQCQIPYYLVTKLFMTEQCKNILQSSWVVLPTPVSLPASVFPYLINPNQVASAFWLLWKLQSFLTLLSFPFIKYLQCHSAIYTEISSLIS